MLIKLGDFVYYEHPEIYGIHRKLGCCIFCVSKSSCYGIVSELWVDEDDEVAVMIDFDFGPCTVRHWDHKHLTVIGSCRS